MSRYRLHEVLVAPARPTAGLGRLAAGIGLIVAGFLMLNLIYYRLLQQLPDWPDILPELFEGTTPRALWIMLGNFLPLLVVLAVVLRMVHERSLRTLLGPRIMLQLDFRRVLRPLVVLFVVVSLLPARGFLDPEPNMGFSNWLVLVPLSLALVLLQVSTEELLFRGYLQSQLAARVNSPLIWMLLPSLLFGALHYDPQTFGPNALMLAIWSVGFGLAAADLTARAGNLGPAIALHLVNNVSAMMITSTQGYWDGLALYVVPFGPQDTEMMRAVLPLEALMVLCCWLTARIAIRR
ncbi:CPBP family intramembrane glutamic endopeptidase [Shimia sediminis]|uniref:CPBP family intramembrane glutamic endopeptidase n=1 Tax=Shimia sediminis TaxID=2497945 RepID=UPI0013DE94AA|nr:CPBP family intramembrane glutamic endopeptidase [Shimia sediminis]